MHKELTEKELKKFKKRLKGELDYGKFWNKHENEAVAAVEELVDIINKLHAINRCCAIDYIVSHLVGRIEIGAHGIVGALHTTIARVEQRAMPKQPQINLVDSSALVAHMKRKQEEAAEQAKHKKTRYVA